MDNLNHANGSCSSRPVSIPLAVKEGSIYADTSHLAGFLGRFILVRIRNVEALFGVYTISIMVGVNK